MSESLPAEILKHASKAAIGLLPAGSIFAELFDAIVGRQQSSATEFITLSLGDAYSAASAAGVSLDQLESNQVFRRTLFAAMRAAVATGSEEKKRRLRNAVVNAAVLPDNWVVDEAKMHRLLEVCDEDHIAFLAKLSTATKYPSLNSGAPQIFQRIIPTPATPPAESAAARDLDFRALSAFNLLFNEGLISRGGLPPPTSPSSSGFSVAPHSWDHELEAELSRYVGHAGGATRECRLTRFGMGFLSFVSRTPLDAE